MNIQKKITINYQGDNFILDKTRIAHWERFVPYKENHEFFLNYFYINKITNGGDTLSKRIRFFSLYQNLKNILKKYPNYNIVECGCFKGCSTYIIAKLLQKNNFNKSFYIFDSFEGLSNFSKEDLNEHNQKLPMAGSFKSDEGVFLQNFKKFNFIDIKKGWIPDRFVEVKNKKFSFINIDVDIYEPTKKSLEFFFPRLIEGGCINIDDYNLREWSGAKKAVDNFLKENEVKIFYEIPLGGCYIIK